MISENINDLIYMAERQSDERLAQELNPQTETGMLGPTWLPASELSYRQKIRAEAQAQPSNAPPVVQQLAQTAMPQPLQNNMASVPPAPIGMPQQPMPTQMMNEGGLIDSLSPLSGLGLMANVAEGGSLMGLLPMMYQQSQSEDEEEKPTAMSAGGLLRYANGGMVDPYALNLQSPFSNSFPMDTIAPMPQDEFESLYGLETLTDYKPAGAYASEALNPAIESAILGRATDLVSEERSPIGYGLETFGRHITGYGTTEESKQEIDARKINLELKDALDDIQTKGGLTGRFRGTKREHDRMTEVENFYEGLMDYGQATGGSPQQRMMEDDTLTMSRFFAKNPEEYAKLNYLTENFGPKEGLIKYSEANQGLIDRLNKGSEEIDLSTFEVIEETLEKVKTDGTSPPPPPPPDQVNVGGNTATNLKNQGVQQSTLSGFSTGAESDIGTGLLDTSIENMIKDMTDPKGKMQDKWLAIAAGAFNAAQKGSPTLIQGLADLGGGVVGQLQNLKKEDQLKAQQLFDLYKTKATIQSSLRGQNLTYFKSIADANNKSIDQVMKATNDYHTQLNKLRETGKLDDVSRMELSVSYAGFGLPDAQIAYQRGITTLAEQENIVEAEVRKDLELGPKDELTDEAGSQIRNKMQEFLEDNPHLRILNEDYWSNAVDKEGNPLYKWNARQLRFSP